MSDSKLLELLAKHLGHIGKISEELRLTRHEVEKYLEAEGLTVLAEQLRAAGKVKGPRPSLPGGRLDPAGDEQFLRERLAEAVNPSLSSTTGRRGFHPDEIAAEMGVSRRVLYKLMAKFGIEPPWEQPEYKARRRAELTEAIKAHGFTQAGAAKALKVSRMTVQRWMKAFDVSTDILRPRAPKKKG